MLSSSYVCAVDAAIPGFRYNIRTGTVAVGFVGTVAQ